MTYIGIDQSLTSFAAVALTHDGAETLRINPTQTGVRRLLEIRRIFQQWLDTLPNEVDHICMEGYANGAKFAREAMGEAGAITKVTLAEYYGLSSRAAFPTFVQPLQVKQFAGDTKALKDDLKLLVFKHWGFETRDHNIADAYILAKIAEAMVIPPPLAYQRLIIEKLQGKNEWEVSPAKATKSAKRAS